MNLKEEIQKLGNVQEKIDFLKDSYKDQDCYILTCGPSLNEHDEDFLREFFKDKLVLSVKQAYNRYPEVTDFHFFNCCNLPVCEEKFVHYNYDNLEKKPIVVTSSNYPEGLRWSPYQEYDIFLKVPIRTDENNVFLCHSKKFDDFMLEKTLARPCGPGIMLENVIYFAIHLGVKNIFALGWDLSYNNIKNVDNYKHFFGNTKSLINRGDILDWEVEAARDLSKDLFAWLQTKGITLNVVSSQSSLHEDIPRIKLQQET